MPLLASARPVYLAVALGLSVALVAGCGSSSAGATGSTPAAGTSTGGASTSGSSAGSSSGTTNKSGPTDVVITVTNATGCSVSPDTAPAGVVNFSIKNVDATGVTELELVSGQRILGEQENLTPGFASTFTVKVDGGAYDLYCPGAKTEHLPFTVTGSSAPAANGSTAALLKQATVDYATYVDNQVAFMVPNTEKLVAAIKTGNLADAQAAYANARPYYERIEPVAESFPDLDAAIDERIGDVPAGATWTGYHAIEHVLFAKKTTAGLTPLTNELTKDVADLQAKTAALSALTKAGKKGGYQAFEIANGASALLDEVLKSKITGEEETYSKIDLLDFQANVEGSLQAFATLEPALNAIDPTVVPTISAKFTALTTLLDTYRSPKALGGWTPYTDLTSADKKQLTDALLAVQAPLALVSAKITT